MGLKNNNFILILLICFLFTSLFYKANANDPEVDDETSYSYVIGAPNGPHNWANLNPNWTCCGTGRKQSPINIANLIISSREDLIREYTPAPAQIKYRGHDIEVVWIGDAGDIVISGTEFKLEQCHWHLPSEHTVHSRRYNMELHIVQYSAERDIAVVGILYTLGRAGPFPTQDGTVGLGFVIRNSKGVVLLAGAKRCPATGENSTVIEALAMRFGAERVRDEGLTNVLLESDSRNLVLALRGDLEVDPSSLLLVDDIRSLSRVFNCLGFNFTHHSANSPAHAFAHIGVGKDFEKIWRNDFPDCCNVLILNDVRREPLLS
ncbi:hypothetical protein ACS0TY_003036 [Phlomoides rotata]